jgi:hypothetical protein
VGTLGRGVGWWETFEERKEDYPKEFIKRKIHRSQIHKGKPKPIIVVCYRDKKQTCRLEE